MKNSIQQRFRREPVLYNRSTFLARLATLLKEGYTFHDSLYLLLPHHLKEYQTVLTRIDNDFKEGLNVTHILRRFGFSSSHLLPIVIAEQDGRLTEALEGMATRLENADQAKRKLKNLLAYPAVLFLFITILLVGFRKFFLPNLQALALSRQGSSENGSALLLAIVSRLPDIFLGTGLMLGLLGIIGLVAYGKLHPARIIHLIGRLPIGGSLFIMWKTRIFASELGQLLQSGLAMQDALTVLMKQTLDPVLSEIARNVKMHVIYGEPFHVAVRLTSGLTKQLSAFAEHGANSGHLPKELVIYSEHLDETIHRRLTKGLAFLQPTLFSLIAICILAAYLALLLPIYGMLNTM